MTMAAEGQDSEPFGEPEDAGSHPKEPIVPRNKNFEGKMEIIAAAAAFMGLFTLWVVLPRKFLRK